MKNESKNTTNTANTVNNTNKNILNTNSVNTTNVTISAQTTQTQPNKKEETEKTAVELKFSKTVDGEIVRDFAVDSLIYSETLQEWTTHTGIDIKADKTTVVKSAEAGTVKSIKNDPRYGMTIVIEHENGFKTVYYNLLTS